MTNEIKGVLMLDQEFLNWLIFAFGATVSAIIATIWDTVRDLQKEDKLITEKLSAVQMLVVGDYVKKPDFDRVIDRLFKKLDKIDQSLTEKQDR
tara:strand:+ start:354 stop:635 length:282 start_codon:yes stop_codon:yes gene_type:complete